MTIFFLGEKAPHNNINLVSINVEGLKSRGGGGGTHTYVQYMYVPKYRPPLFGSDLSLRPPFFEPDLCLRFLFFSLLE